MQAYALQTDNMRKLCKFCNTVLGENDLKCPTCGKVYEESPLKNKSQARESVWGAGSQFSSVELKPEKTRSEMRSQSGTYGKDYTQFKKPTNKGKYDEDIARDIKRSARSKNMELPDLNLYKGGFEKNLSSGKAENASHLKPFINKLIKFILVIVLLYCGFVVYRVMSTSHRMPYLKTDKKIQSESYSKAFYVYFRDGMWKYNFLEDEVYYEGIDFDENKYVIVFSKSSEIDEQILTMNCNGEDVLKKDYNDKLVKMFTKSAAVAAI